MTGNGDYSVFLDRKAQLGSKHGFDPVWMPDFLFDFQRVLVEWSLLKGRSAIFADCGLGKTPIQLVWAENVARKTGGNVLILTPLAVGGQTVREGEKFGVECRRSLDGTVYRITVANYERLHYFSPGDFSGVVCDESSILKCFDGVTQRAVTQFMSKIPYRLLCTATAAPNDYIELGTSSEALGELGRMDMLQRFFKNDSHSVNPTTFRRSQNSGLWRFKGHAEIPFWRWVCSWARALRAPSDMGFDDAAFVLPPKTENEWVVESRSIAPGKLFDVPAVGLQEQREERKRTIGERCEHVAKIVMHSRPVLVWCHLNVEGDLLERLIPDSEQVSGRDSDEAKEEKLLAFADGKLRVLVTKPVIGAWGLNFQHCSHVTFFPSHSYEQYYQGVRRCWRFGQTSPVQVDIIATKGDQGVMENLQRKSLAADRMFENLVMCMHQQLSVERNGHFTESEVIPLWL